MIRYILALASLTFLFSFKSYSQNRRWMYIDQTDDKAYIFVDTVSADIKQDHSDYYHRTSVTFWAMFYQKKIKNKKPSIIKFIEKVSVDTIKNQYQTSSRVEYRNNVPIKSDSALWAWEDVIPGTITESFVKFAKSTNNKNIKIELYANAYIHQALYPKLKENE